MSSRHVYNDIICVCNMFQEKHVTVSGSIFSKNILQMFLLKTMDALPNPKSKLLSSRYE